MSKGFALVLVLVLLITMALGVVCVRSVRAQYQGDITINADGGVSPSSAPVKQAGNIYTLTSDLNGKIAVNKNNMVFDGNGHKLNGEFSMNDVSSVTLKNLSVAGSEFGIELYNTSNATVVNNTITGTGISVLEIYTQATAGINIELGGSNTIAENNVTNNYNGISFVETENNLVIENTITNSMNPINFTHYDSYGLRFWGASNNTIYHNNFINNTEQAGDSASTNIPYSINVWDDGYPNGGNYWSNYRGNQIDSSGIGNTPYVIDEQNKDRYPLIHPFNNTLYALEMVPPKISVLSPLNQTYNESSIPLVYSVDKTVDWKGYSLDGKQNITIAANDTIANITNGLHSVTVYANDTFGNMGSSTTSFTVAKPEPFPVVPVAAVSIAVAVVCVGIILYVRKRKG